MTMPKNQKSLSPAEEKVLRLLAGHNIKWVAREFEMTEREVVKIRDKALAKLIA
jgi:DNA-binding CsgD family transcriptional regulator